MIFSCIDEHQIQRRLCYKVMVYRGVCFEEHKWRWQFKCVTSLTSIENGILNVSQSFGQLCLANLSCNAHVSYFHSLSFDLSNLEFSYTNRSASDCTETRYFRFQSTRNSVRMQVPNVPLCATILLPTKRMLACWNTSSQLKTTSSQLKTHNQNDWS